MERKTDKEEMTTTGSIATVPMPMMQVGNTKGKKKNKNLAKNLVFGDLSIYNLSEGAPGPGEIGSIAISIDDDEVAYPEVKELEKNNKIWVNDNTLYYWESDTETIGALRNLFPLYDIQGEIDEGITKEGKL